LPPPLAEPAEAAPPALEPSVLRSPPFSIAPAIPLFDPAVAVEGFEVDLPLPPQARLFSAPV